MGWQTGSELTPTINPRLERVKSILVCPECQVGLDFGTSGANCRACGMNYEIREGKIFFTQAPDRDDELDRLKALLKKRLGKYYYTIGVDVIAPDYPVNLGKLIFERLNPKNHIIVDVGSGNRRVHEDIICLDLFDYEEVDIVCDARRLPFAHESVDGVVTRYLLEHVSDPWSIVSGFEACTRLGGLGIHLVPFLYPFHASPHDYHRFTHKGAQLLFQGWELVEQRNVSGPVTLFLLGIIEFLSICLSFGLDKPKRYLYLCLCLLLFPVKYLDVFFVSRKNYIALAPTFVTVVRKAQLDRARKSIGK